LEKDALDTAFSQLLEEGRLMLINDSGSGDEPLLAADAVLRVLRRTMETELAQFHTVYPLWQGMPREELKSKLKLNQKEFNAILAWWIADSAIKADTSRVLLPEFSVVFTPEQEKKRGAIIKQMTESPFSPPGLKECCDLAGNDLVNALIDSGALVKVSDEVVFTRQAFDTMKDWVEYAVRGDGAVTVASFRDHFTTSRRYALALLEYLDAVGFTVRDGDFRKLRGKQP
jgi:selenocysteine-specific elongation factor